MKRLLRLVAIFAVVGGTFCYLSVQRNKPKIDHSLKYAPTLAITPGYDIQQDFVVSGNNFSSLSFFFTTPPGTDNKGLIRIALMDGERIVYESDVDAASLPRDILYTISFPEECASIGKTYRLKITGLPCEWFAGGQHAMLVPKAQRPDSPLVTVNGGQWPYVLYTVPAYGRPTGLTTAIAVSLLMVLLLLWGAEEWTAMRKAKSAGQAAGAKKSGVKANFDWGMHYFRAFAILSIAVEHYLCLTGYTPWSSAWFQTGTVYFLFISGYLCQYLHTKRPDTPLSYYRKKLTNVITPYLIWTVATLGIVYFYGFSRPGVIKPEAISASSLAKIFIYGKAQLQYWYIPFVSLVFVVSPLLARVKDSVLCALCFAFSVLMITTEGYRDLGTLPGLMSTYCLFMGPYLYGMAFSRFRTVLEPLCRKYVWIALGLGVFCALTIAYPGMFIMKYDNHLLVTAVQKIMFTIVAIVVLQAVSTKKNWVMDQIAKLSFTIYFCHMFFISDFSAIKTATLESCQFLPDCFVMIVLCVAYLAFLLLFSYVLKVAFGKSSRIFIGS